jgi:hypothetical protein
VRHTKHVKRAFVLAALLVVLPRCNQTPTSQTTCIDLEAQYVGVFRDSCGGTVTTPLTLFRTTGCHFIAEVPGLGTMQGTVDGAFLVLTVAFSPCGGSAAGSAQIDAHGNLSGSYNGNQTAAGCCSSVSASFTLTRQ